MKTFNFGYSVIDNNVSFNETDLIVLAARPGMGKSSLALNILYRNKNKKGCYISLNETKEKIEIKLIKINKSYSLRSKSKDLGNDLLNNSMYDIAYLELPSLIELIEFIVQRKNNFDYFIIDNMSYIDTDVESLFSKNKNYHYILRHLKSLCIAMNKNIILLSNIHMRIEEEPIGIEEEPRFAYSYYGHKEKYIDYLIALHRPKYYDFELYSINEFNDKETAIIYFAKTREETIEHSVSLIFDWSNSVFFNPNEL